MNTAKERYVRAQRLLESDAHDGPLVLLLWDRTGNTGVGLDVVNTEDAAETMADEYMKYLESRRYEIRVVAFDLADDDLNDDDDTDDDTDTDTDTEEQ